MKLDINSNGPRILIIAAAILAMGQAFPACPERNPLEETRHNIEVITYNGGFIPTDQLYVGTGPDCGGGGVPHWHANGKVEWWDKSITTNIDAPTKFLSDPNPEGCGFCKVSECPKHIENIFVGTEPAPQTK